MQKYPFLPLLASSMKIIVQVKSINILYLITFGHFLKWNIVLIDCAPSGLKKGSGFPFSRGLLPVVSGTRGWDVSRFGAVQREIDRVTSSTMMPWNTGVRLEIDRVTNRHSCHETQVSDRVTRSIIFQKPYLKSATLVTRHLNAPAQPYSPY